MSFLTIQEKIAIVRANHPTGVATPYKSVSFDGVSFVCLRKGLRNELQSITPDEYYQSLWFMNASHYGACRELLDNSYDTSSLRKDKMSEFATE